MSAVMEFTDEDSNSFAMDVRIPPIDVEDPSPVASDSTPAPREDEDAAATPVSGRSTRCNSTSTQSAPAAMQEFTAADSSPTPYMLQEGARSPPRCRMTPIGSMANVSSEELTTEEKSQLIRKNMTVIFSSIYAVMVVSLGGVLYVTCYKRDTRYISEIFSSCTAGLGMLWLLFLHVDLYRYKLHVIRQLRKEEENLQEVADRLSNYTSLTLPSFLQGPNPPPYRFLRGRHSTSFYLKIGMAAFCFGHLISVGLQMGHQILNFVNKEKKAAGCGSSSALVIYSLRPLYSFYQLFIVFKYSNVIINRFKGLARFAMMHLIATCLCVWFSTIVDYALDDYEEKINKNVFVPGGNETSSNGTFRWAEWYNGTDTTVTECYNDILSPKYLKAIPYLYPFTIEFNLLLAGVWFIVWQNIGLEHIHANPTHFQHKISNDNGVEEVIYQSNLVISADCHASNKGLFAGLFVLFTAIITVIVFFVAINSDGYDKLGVNINMGQEATLTIVSLVAVIVAYFQTSRLDINLHPVTLLDDILLFLPIPFFFVHSILSLIAEFNTASGGYDVTHSFRIVMQFLITLQVILQTPFIIDGLRRCSNSQKLRYKKPGREVVTFLIVCNLTMWIINTFEVKSVEPFHNQTDYYGSMVWMFVSHTTLPLMLFYRFHSSVCLADMWKAAYEKSQ